MPYLFTFFILHFTFFIYRGGDRARTGVQTYSSKAFYMLICSLIVGRAQGNNKPTFFLAE